MHHSELSLNMVFPRVCCLLYQCKLHNKLNFLLQWKIDYMNLEETILKKLNINYNFITKMIYILNSKLKISSNNQKIIINYIYSFFIDILHNRNKGTYHLWWNTTLYIHRNPFYLLGNTHMKLVYQWHFHFDPIEYIYLPSKIIRKVHGSRPSYDKILLRRYVSPMFFHRYRSFSVTMTCHN